MPLYQPSNITPSSFAGIGGGTIAAESPIAITWQVNGNVPMTAFKIDFYTVDSSNTPVYSTGIIQSGYGLPFYGLNELGDPVFFTYNPNATYASIGITNGNQYKFVITQYWGGQTTDDYSVVQFSESVFNARKAPTLSINDFGGTVYTVANTFTAAYAQAQGDTVDTVRWILKDNTANETVQDTGIVRTPVLSFTFKGFINGHSYSLQCDVQTESGVPVSTEATFNCVYAQTPTSNELSLSCAGNGGVKVEWGAAMDIPGVASSEDGYSISGQVLRLNAGETITWDEVDGEPMDLTDPNTVSWRGAMQSAYSEVATDSSQTTNYGMYYENAYFSPDGTKVAVILKIGSYDGAIYSISENSVQLIGRFLHGGQTPAFCGAWSKDSTKFVYGGGDVSSSSFGSFLQVLEVSETAILQSTVITPHPMQGYFSALCFSEDGSTLYATRSYRYGRPSTFTYSYDGTSFTLQSSYLSLPTLQFDGVYVDGILCAASKIIFFGRAEKDTRVWIDVYADGDTIEFENQENLFTSAQKTYGDITADGKYFYLNTIPVSGASTAYVFNLSNGITEVQSFNDLTNQTNISVSADGKTLSISNRLYGFNVDTQKYEYYGDVNAVTNAILSKDATKIVSIQHPYKSNETKQITVTLSAQDQYEIMRFGKYSFAQQGIFGLFTTDGEMTLAQIPLTASAASTILYYKNEDAEPTFGIIALDENDKQVRGTIEVPTPQMTQGISAVALIGAQTCNFAHISSAFPFDNSFTPKWDSNTLFYANFTDGLQAGTISESGSRETAIYRSENGKLIPLLRVPSSVTSIIDYGVKNGATVGYTGYFVDGDVYSAPTESSETICMRMLSYYLYECTQDKDNSDVYHVQKIFTFGNNADGGSISNNNAPNFLENFTKYPMRQPSAQMPKSGTLSAMLSNVQNGQYADTAEQMEALYGLSASTNTFFLKDRKGNLYMVGLAGPITQQINDQSALQEVSVSLPWREIGDANGKVIIQTPLDSSFGQGAENTNGTDNVFVTGEQSVTITENGTTVVEPSNGISAMSKVTITTDVRTYKTISGTITPTSASNTISIQHGLGTKKVIVFLEAVPDSTFNYAYRAMGGVWLSNPLIEDYVSEITYSAPYLGTTSNSLEATIQHFGGRSINSPAAGNSVPYNTPAGTASSSELCYITSQSDDEIVIKNRYMFEAKTFVFSVIGLL